MKKDLWKDKRIQTLQSREDFVGHFGYNDYTVQCFTFTMKVLFIPESKTSLESVYKPYTKKTNEWRDARARRQGDSLLPPHKIIGCQWIYKVKDNSNNSINQYKAWLITKCYAQNHAVNYYEIFALVVSKERWKWCEPHHQLSSRKGVTKFPSSQRNNTSKLMWFNSLTYTLN